MGLCAGKLRIFENLAGTYPVGFVVRLAMLLGASAEVLSWFEALLRRGHDGFLVFRCVQAKKRLHGLTLSTTQYV